MDQNLNNTVLCDYFGSKLAGQMGTSRFLRQIGRMRSIVLSQQSRKPKVYMAHQETGLTIQTCTRGLHTKLSYIQIAL